MLRTFILLSLALALVACTGSRPAAQLDTVNDGYGDISKKNNTGSIANVDGDDSGTPLDVQISRLPGVEVRGQGSNAEVRVRGGNNSFTISTEPLFVLDGQAVNGGYSSVFSMVNPNDVDDISVLKGSSATMYGTRGANGVIVIRTKR